ncbi:S-adenosyl-L-methionine-dependent methyltransferase [Xylariales sp. PMI_506]|nr:S-adenosyl-L-methionine-dependent methyltransferase [Xylariales sp. PMI_506]
MVANEGTQLPATTAASASAITSNSAGDPENIDTRTISKLSSEGLPKERVQLTGVEQTLLSMVNLKAVDASKRFGEPILNDPYSQQLLDRCDVDINSKLMAEDPRWVRYVCGRTKRLDQWCQEFLRVHENEPVTVLHLACGLDLRYFRLEKPGDVLWIDVDQPMVVNLRQRLVDLPTGEDYHLRTLTVASEGWLNDLPTNRLTLIIAEGLFPYFETAAAEKTIREMVEYFGTGELIFDVQGSLVARFSAYSKALRGTNISFKWGVDDVYELEKLHPKLKLRDSVASPEWLGHEPFGQSQPPWFGTLVTAVASLTSSFKNNGQIARFEF